MTVHHYAGGKMLGIETKLQRRLKILLEQGMGTELLTRENLIGMTSAELNDAMIELGDSELNQLIRNNKGILEQEVFHYAFFPNDAQVKDAWAVYPLKLKPGLDTKVLSKGKVITLAQYVDLEEGELLLSSLNIDASLNMYSGKQVAIYTEE